MVTRDAADVRVDVHLTPEDVADALATDVRDGLQRVTEDPAAEMVLRRSRI